MEPDKRTHSVPLETEDGEVVIEQQNVGTSVSGMPTGNETITEVIDEYEDAGYAGQFMAATDGQLKCLTCNQDVRADEVAVYGLRRLEGVSDPADMSAIAALECPRCGAKGTVAIKYGPEASPDEADVLRVLEKEPLP